jgi:mannose-6-phosphate isomerase-like protein (cupin superfamily)
MKLAEQCAQQEIPKQEGKNYSAMHAGKFADLRQYKLQHPIITDRKVAGKLFIRDHIGLTGMQISLNSLPPGVAVPFGHMHKVNEELYIFTSGKGQIQIDGDVIDVQEGSCVRVAPGGDRTWRNNGEENLYYIVIQARENSLTQDTFDDGLPSEAPIVWPE